MSLLERLLRPLLAVIANPGFPWIAGVVLVVLGVLAIPTVQIAHWVGITNAVVTFKVVDEQTGKPIPESQVHIWKDPRGLAAPPENGTADLVIHTGHDGTAIQSLGDCTSYGASGGFEDTYHLGLPDWLLRASAEGFESSEWVSLGLFGYHVDSRPRAGRRFATTTVPIKLKNVKAIPSK